MNMSNHTIHRNMKPLTTLNNEQGIALVLTMIFLVVLSLMGITALRSSRVELQIAGNEKWATDSFYRSESGNDTVTRLLEDLSSGKVGGAKTSLKDFTYGEVLITDLDFDLGQPEDTEPKWADPADSASLYADVFMPKDSVDNSKGKYMIAKNQPLTQIIAGKRGKKPVGGPTETGRSAGSSGSKPEATFDIWTRNNGIFNAESVLHTRWLHIDR